MVLKKNLRIETVSGKTTRILIKTVEHNYLLFTTNKVANLSTKNVEVLLN